MVGCAYQSRIERQNMLNLIGIKVDAKTSLPRRIANGLTITVMGVLVVVAMLAITGCGAGKLVKTGKHANQILEQPAIQSGDQAVITCKSGLVHIDGIEQGETVTVKWASPVISIKSTDLDMVKTLYCVNGSIRSWEENN